MLNINQHLNLLFICVLSIAKEIVSKMFGKTKFQHQNRFYWTLEATFSQNACAQIIKHSSA